MCIQSPHLYLSVFRSFPMQAGHPIFIQKQCHHVVSVQFISGDSSNLILDSPPIAGAAITWFHFCDGFLEADKRVYRFFAGRALGAVDNGFSQASFAGVVSTRSKHTRGCAFVMPEGAWRRWVGVEHRVIWWKQGVIVLADRLNLVESTCRIESWQPFVVKVVPWIVVGLVS